MPPTSTLAGFLCTIAEATRLRLLNCLAAAPLFVTDLQAVLDLPQPTVSRHLTVLRRGGAVQDTPVGQYVLYRLLPDRTPKGRLMAGLLEALLADEQMQIERHRARDRSRSRARHQGGRASA
jgi:ArsR family transcriptional regulator, arsenate/arsenite/antimonite-responsive transcriptional repressor